MESLIFGTIIVIIAVIAFMIKLPQPISKLKSIGAAVGLALGVLIIISGGVAYNDAGYLTHARTIFGTESAKLDLGWYFRGWGKTTVYPKYITIAHTSDPAAEGSSVSVPYKIRLADNWSAEVTQTTRFGLPIDEDQFLRLSRDLRSPQRLIATLLKPAVEASLDTVANLYTLEEYFVDGKRDDFKTEFLDTISKGRAKLSKIESKVVHSKIEQNVSPNDSKHTQDTSNTGSNNTTKIVAIKETDASGQVKRLRHGFMDYGIVVNPAGAILQNLDPDDVFESQIQERKDASARRSVARERRLEEESQRLLAIATGEKNIAVRQAEAKTIQIEKTTEADTEKKLALIKSTKIKEQAAISKETSLIDFERAQIDAKSIKVTADANA